MRSKRLIVITGTILIICFGIFSAAQAKNISKDTGIIRIETPARAAGQKNVLQLRCEPISTVRFALIGLGHRGQGAIKRSYLLKFLISPAVTGIN